MNTTKFYINNYSYGHKNNLIYIDETGYYIDAFGIIKIEEFCCDMNIDKININDIHVV